MGSLSQTIYLAPFSRGPANEHGTTHAPRFGSFLDAAVEFGRGRRRWPAVGAVFAAAQSIRQKVAAGRPLRCGGLERRGAKGVRGFLLWCDRRTLRQGH